MSESAEISLGVIVPTLGTRSAFLAECVTSIRAAGPCRIVLVRPRECSIDPAIVALTDVQVDDPGMGLAAAINAGIAALPPGVRRATWLGDDDRLLPGSLSIATEVMDRESAALVYGGCRYIDANGQQLWVNGSGRWAVPLMRFGPQLVPQPGSLFDRRVFDSIGGLDETLKWAFDLDLFLRLVERGRACFVAATLAEFRWHDGSLSVGGRQGSVAEASAVRRRFLPRALRPLSIVWEPLLRRVILLAGERINRRVRSTVRAGDADATRRSRRPG
jgi:GT2 family glycosyltransferase